MVRDLPTTICKSVVCDLKKTINDTFKSVKPKTQIAKNCISWPM